MRKAVAFIDAITCIPVPRLWPAAGRSFALKLFACLLLFLPSGVLHAQEESAVVYQGRKYLDLNIRSLDKYSNRIQRRQEQLLSRLRRKEERLSRQLKHSDSAAYARFRSQPLSYDSISRMLHPDSAALAARTAGKGNRVVDSLKAVAGFVQSKAGNLNINTDYNNKLGDLQSRLSYQQYISSLIDQRSQSLKEVGDAPALKGLEKEVFYARARMKVFKELSEQPSKAEELALEYLQGSKGFSFEKSSGEGSSMQGAGGEADLEKLGFQTKRQMSEQLQKQFGDNLSGLQQQMGSQISSWQSATGSLQSGVSKGQEAVGNLQSGAHDIKNTAEETRQSFKKLTDINRPSFKVNPMRGLPFWQRLEKGYSFQTSRATPDGKTPALLQLSAFAGFRHTPRLSYGVGLAASVGLGQDWSHIHFSLEGLGARSYLKYELFWGISGYGGYERMFRQVSFGSKQTDQPAAIEPYNSHYTKDYSESLLLGLSKSYHMNSKWNGAVQLLYDLWWKEKGLNSPIVLRFQTVSNK